MIGTDPRQNGGKSTDMNTAGRFKIQIADRRPESCLGLPASSGLKHPGPAVRPTVVSVWFGVFL